MINIQSQGQEWEVERILQRGRFKNITHYLILWKGYSADEATWEPITNLQHCQQAIIQFEKGLKTMTKETPPEKKEKKRKINFDNIFKSPEENNANTIKIEGNPTHSQDLEILQKIPQKESILHQSKNSTEPDSKLLEVQPSIKEGIHLVAKKDNGVNSQIVPDILIPQKEETCEDLCQFGLSRKKIKLNQPYPLKQISITNKELTLNSNNQQATPKEVAPSIKERQFFSDKVPSKKITSNVPFPIQKKSSQFPEEVKPLFDCVQEKMQKQVKVLPSNPSNKIEKEAVSDRKQIQSLSIDLSRYNLCDNELQLQQKECLMNILRKKTGEKRTKPLIKIVDISHKEEFLSIISGLKLIYTSSCLEYLDLLIKVRYGWMAIGRTRDSEYIMIDVNLIKEESWSSLIKYLSKD